jgi:DNA-binding NarL/FixJ family response regulator
MRQIRVVWVDDDPYLRHIARRFLEQAGELAMLEMTDTQHARDVILQTRPEVVVMDMDRAKSDVLDTIGGLRACAPTLPIIALTWFDADCYHQAALAAGATALVTKDSLHTELVPCIHRVVKSHA